MNPKTYLILPILLLLGCFQFAQAQQPIRTQAVFFDSDEYHLTQTQKQELQIWWMNTLDELGAPIQVTVAGHTDVEGSDGYNLRLSERRAKSVQKQLGMMGLSAQILATEAYGEKKPVAEAWEQNRRVEITLTFPEGADSDRWNLENASADAESEKPVMSLNELYDQLRTPALTFRIDPNKDNFLNVQHGSKIFIPKHSFVDGKGNKITKPVSVSVRSGLKKSEMVLNRLTTNQGDHFLESGGMYEILANLDGTELELRRPINLLIPTDDPNSGAQWYNGMRAANGLDLTWELAANEQVILLTPEERAILRDYSRIRGKSEPREPICKLFCRMRKVVSKKYRKRKDEEYENYVKELEYMQDIKEKAEMVYQRMNGAVDGKSAWNAFADFLGETKSGKMGQGKAGQEAQASLPKDQQYYLNTIQRLGWGNTDWLTKYGADQVSKVTADLPFDENTDVMILFADRNTLLGYNQRLSGTNYVFPRIPKDVPFFMIGLRTTSEGVEMAVNGYVASEKSESFELDFRPVEIGEIQNEMKRVDGSSAGIGLNN